MMAGYNDTDAKSATTTLISPGFKGSEHPKECLSFWYAIGVSNFMAGVIKFTASLYIICVQLYHLVEIHFHHILQNEGGEINYFAVNVLNNDNNKASNVWSLPAPKNQDWNLGKVEVSSNGDKEYQVSWSVRII